MSGGLESGYLRFIDQHEIATAVGDGIRLLCVEVQVGEYVRLGDVLLRAWSDQPPAETFAERMRGAFRIDRDRSVQQDPLFGIKQLVDIGAKALSPGVNDPTTAEQALDHLGEAMTMLLHRSLPSPMRMLDGGTRVLFRTPSFADYVDASFAQMRRAARSDLHVSLYLIGILRKLVEQSSDPARAAVLSHQLEEVIAGFDVEGLTGSERDALQSRSWRGNVTAEDLQQPQPH
jgi:uncharacterized membrane protein